MILFRMCYILFSVFLKWGGHMTSIREEISKNLLYYRKKAGLTQKEFADKLGVKNTAVSNWEKGNNSIDIETLFKACKVLDVSLSDMYGQFSGQTLSSIQLTQEEDRLLYAYRNLNSEGQSKLFVYADDLIQSKKYQKINTQ